MGNTGLASSPPLLLERCTVPWESIDRLLVSGIDRVTCMSPQGGRGRISFVDDWTIRREMQDDGKEANNDKIIKIGDGICVNLFYCLEWRRRRIGMCRSLVKLVNADNGEASRMRKEWTMTGRKSGAVPAVSRHPEALL